MKITLIHPSRGRAEKAYKTYEYWMSKAFDKANIEHILSIDNDDVYISDYRNAFISSNSMILFSDNTCVVDATNVAAKKATGDILIYLSDDFKCPMYWDVLLVKKFKDINSPMLVKVDDCLQKFHIAVLTIPIMNKELYQKLRYFWHPEYKSMFVDEHLYWITHNNNWLSFAPELKFPHEHPCTGLAENDETYKRSANNWEQGKALFAKHKSLNFPL
jgi:hypothetical protein